MKNFIKQTAIDTNLPKSLILNKKNKNKLIENNNYSKFGIDHMNKLK
jgi:hypothetical protein